MDTVKRPLSPHLQVYKPQITSVLSITHRATGVFLSLGTLFLTCWLVGIAASETAFNHFQQHVEAWYGKILLSAFVFSLYYHLCNGIRHLCWDSGLGLEIDTTYKTGYTVIAVSVVLTAITIIAGVLA